MGWLIDDSETALIDEMSADLVRAAGVPVKLHVQNTSKGWDSVYNEPGEGFSYDGPYETVVMLLAPDRDGEISERGAERIQKTSVEFSRAVLEDDGCPMPKEGDVLEFWNGQFDLQFPKDVYHTATGEPGPNGPWPIKLTMEAIRRERMLPERKTGTVIPEGTV